MKTMNFILASLLLLFSTGCGGSDDCQGDCNSDAPADTTLVDSQDLSDSRDGTFIDSQDLTDSTDTNYVDSQEVTDSTDDAELHVDVTDLLEEVTQDVEVVEDIVPEIVPAGPFIFATTAPSQYQRVDRIGEPIVTTLLITYMDEYNQGDPVTDLTFVFAEDIIPKMAALHDILDDDLTALGLTPCTVAEDGSGTCIGQAAPILFPDVLHIDTQNPAGFPNGLLLTDPAPDIMLGLVLLDASAQSVTTFVGVLNPIENDVSFLDTFPFLAPPH